MKEAILDPLKDNAADIARGLGPDTTVDQVLDFLDSIFGRKTNPDVLMQGFYRIVQEPKVKVSHFGIRLKVALDRIMVFYPESLTKDETTKKHRDRFYYSVRQNVREALRYYYEVSKADYTALLTKARSIETEKLALTSTLTMTMKSATQMRSKPSCIEDLNQQMNKLMTMVKDQKVKDRKRENKNVSNRKTYNGDKDGRNLRGPDPNASGPFRNGDPPIQCDNCWDGDIELLNVHLV